MVRNAWYLVSIVPDSEQRPTLDSNSPVSRALLLGLASGLRAVVPLAPVTWAARTGRMRVSPGLAFRLLADETVGLLAMTVAVAEVILDKMPFMPRRSLPLRLINGAGLGAAVFAAEDEPIAIGAAIGATAAYCGALAGYHARRLLTRMGLPDVLVGLLEDSLTVVLTRLAA
jgi:uncharacterized membrane protein